MLNKINVKLLRVGLRQLAIYPGAIAESRKLKPEIPAYGENGIAIADEIEYEWSLP
jgi:hypothetical protein